MFAKSGWEVGDRVVVNGIHGVIKEFNSTGNRVKMEHRDNENQPYFRWYDVLALPPYPPLPSPTTPSQRDEAESPVLSLKEADEVLFGVDGASDDKTLDVQEVPAVLPTGAIVGLVADDLPDDVDALKQMVRKQRERLANQAASIETLMGKDIDTLEDKYEQLHEDYEALAKKMLMLEEERDALKKVNAHQSELLKQASPSPAFSTDVNKDKIIDSLRAENSQLHRDLDKALKSPHDALEMRMARMEAKLEEATDWIEGAVSRSMDEADEAMEARVNTPSNVTDISQVMLAFAKAFAMVGQEKQVANG